MVYSRVDLEKWRDDLTAQRAQIIEQLAQVNGAIQLLNQLIEKIDDNAKQPESAETNAT